MPPESDVSIDPRVLDAYRAAVYEVRVPGGAFVLRFGIRSTELEDLHSRHGVSSSAFLTAWNPRSRPTDATRNERAQKDMEADLRAMDCTLFDGMGSDATGTWPAERSVLALGISGAQAREVGGKYAQNAVLYMDADAVPDLLLIQ